MKNQENINTVKKNNLPINYPSTGQSFGIAGITVLGMVLMAPVIMAADYLGKDLSLLIYYVLAMGIPFLIVHTIRKKKTGISGFDLEFGNLRSILLITLAIIALQIGVTTPITSLIPMSETMKETFLNFLGGNGLITFIMVVVAAPFLEEFIFRGIILNGLLKRYSPWFSIFLSSFLFGIIHMNPWQFTSAMIIGVFAGWVYYKTNKLSYTIIIHMANNFFALITSYFFTDEQLMEMDLVSKYGSVTNALLITLGAIIIAVINIYFLTKTLKKSEKEKGNKIDEIVIG